MTVVSALDMYEYPIQNDTATCESCGKEMELPDTEDPDRDMKEPFWYREEVHTYLDMNLDKFKAYCKTCYNEKMQEEVAE